MRALQLVLLATLAILTSACSRSRDGAPTPRPEPVLVNVAAEDETDWSALLAGFTADTGIPVTLRPRVSDTLVTAVVDNSEKPPADVLITPSARGVWHAADEGATRPIRTAALTERVPDQLRDPDGLWTALAYRAIAIVAATPSARDVGGYAELSEPDYDGRLCLTSSTLAVNRALVAMLIAELGTRPAEIVVRGWMRNLARPVFGSEPELLAAVAGGSCEIGIASSDAARRFIDLQAESTLTVYLPSPFFVDVVGLGIGRHARNPEAALALVEWLLGSDAQRSLSAASGASALVSEEAPPATLSIRAVGFVGWHYDDAVKLVERAAYR